MIISSRIKEGLVHAVKVKVRAEDFVVEEVVSLAIHEDIAGASTMASTAQHRIYILRKRGWNTLDALRILARESKISFEQIHYAGLKDKYASTSQYISVAKNLTLVSSVPGVPVHDLSVEQVGFSDDFVSTRVMVGNRFSITLRDLGEEQARGLLGRVDSVRAAGLPNYYDDQRFGSVPPGGEFLGERVLKGHLKGALRLYMTARYPSMPLHEKSRRRNIDDVWGDWPAVLAYTKTDPEKRVIEALQRGGNKKNLIAALNAIPHEEMSLHFAALQAAVWNEVLRRLVSRTGIAVSQVGGRVGSYIFPVVASGGHMVSPKSSETVLAKCIEHEASHEVGSVSWLRQVEIPTIARRILPCPDVITNTIDEVLAERGIGKPDLNLRGVHSAYLKSFYRKAIVEPGNLTAGEIVDDDFYEGRKAVTLSFELPRGSYATMLLKALSVHD